MQTAGLGARRWLRDVFEAWLNEQVASLPSFSPQVASAAPRPAALPGRLPDPPGDSSDFDTQAGSAQ